MRGREVFYPMGWDDNGLPTERRVENFYGVRAILPALRPGLRPAVDAGPQGAGSVLPPEFHRVCLRLSADDEKAFEELWRPLGAVGRLVHDVHDDRPLAAGQPAGVPPQPARGEAYSAEAPTIWDVNFQTAVAQAEIEDRENSGAYYRYGFERPDGDEGLRGNDPP